LQAKPTTGPNMRKILLDLFCGRGGWSKAALKDGWDTIGIDISHHNYPGRFINSALPMPIPDLLQFSPTLVVASPPCEAYARHHLPWLKGPPPDETLLRWSISLIEKLPCPVLIECSRFAARHVPGSTICGSYALWGNVPAILPTVPRTKTKKSGLRPDLRAEIPAILADWIISTH
jgi:hypothetical protein